MEQKLRLRLHSNGKWSMVDGASYLGRQLENGATMLIVELPSSMFGKSHYLEFAKPSGITTSTAPLKESIDESGIHFITLDVSCGLIDERGRYILQYVAREGSQNPRTYKSDIIAIDVVRSINASYALAGSDPDFINWATNRINKLASNFDEEKTAVRGLIDEGDRLALQNAKSYTDESIRAIVELNNNGSIDTLKEIAKWINDPNNGAALALVDWEHRIKDLETNKADEEDVRELSNRVGNIDAILDSINGEVI